MHVVVPGFGVDSAKITIRNPNELLVVVMMQASILLLTKTTTRDEKSERCAFGSYGATGSGVGAVCRFNVA